LLHQTVIFIHAKTGIKSYRIGLFQNFPVTRSQRSAGRKTIAGFTWKCYLC